MKRKEWVVSVLSLLPKGRRGGRWNPLLAFLPRHLAPCFARDRVICEVFMRPNNGKSNGFHMRCIYMEDPI